MTQRPLQKAVVSVPLAGMAQKSDALARGLGALDLAINAVFDKAGDGGVVIDKRLGYQRVALDNTVGVFDTDAVVTHVHPWGSELVVFTYDYVAALGDRDAAMRGADSLVYRGPCNRGNCRVRFLSQSPISQQVQDDT